MNLEQIKQDKIKEAEDIFLKVGLDPKKDLTRNPYINRRVISQPVQSEEHSAKIKLGWTRLSNSTDVGLIIE